eukprot:scaffold96230_cov30-Prasinocladus_malaysianus.AAC.2
MQVRDQERPSVAVVGFFFRETSAPSANHCLLNLIGGPSPLLSCLKRPDGRQEAGLKGERNNDVPPGGAVHRYAHLKRFTCHSTVMSQNEMSFWVKKCNG